MPRWLPGLLVIITGLCLPGLSLSREQRSDATSPPRAEVAVRDSLGRPIPTAVVRVEASAVQVSAPGYLPWSGTLPPRGEKALRVVLLHPATFRGRVTSKGSGLPAFSIHLNPESGPAAALPAKISIKDQFFEIGSVVPGLVNLRVEAEGFVPLEQPESIREGEVRWLDLELRPASRLVATLLDGKKNPLPGVEARVRLEGADARFLEEAEIKRLSGILSASDKSGRLVLGPLAQGSRYRIILRIEGRPARSLLLTPSTPSVAREINLPAGGTLRLTLKDKDGHPIPGSAARFDSDDAPDVDLLSETRPSGKDGILTLGPLPAGTYSVRLQPEGFRPRTVRGCAVRDGAVSDQGEVRFDPGLEISGTVEDDAGAPIAGAAIRARFYESGRRLTANRKSDREGKFRVAGLPPGPVEIQAEAKGYQPDKAEEVAAGTAGLELELTRSGSLVGTVLADETGMPVPAFSLELHQERGDGDRRWQRPKDFPTTFQNPDGRFSLEGLLPGKYGLGVKARGYKPALMEGVEAGSDDSKPLEIRLETGLEIDGVVLTAEDRAPVSGATVSATDLLPMETDPEGKFQIEGLSGKTMVQVTHPLYLTVRIAEVDPERTPRLEVLLRRGGAVEGSVYGENGEPTPGAEVRANLTEGGRPVTTGPEGRYRMEGLPAGLQALSKVDVPGTYEGFESAMVQVEAGAITTHDFGKGTTLHGIVTYAGAPASNARLTLARITSELPDDVQEAEGSLSVRCGEDGSYETHGLQPGTYGLIVDWEGRKVGKLATIPPGEPTWRMDIDLPDLWLSGEVVDSETHLPLQARVMASQIRQSQSASYTSVMNDGEGEVAFSSDPQSEDQTDAQGRFRLPLLEPAKYRVFTIASGYQMEQPLEVDVRASRNDLVVELAPAIALSVKAVDAATGKALALSCASVNWDSSRHTSCGDGAGRLTSLRPGAVVVAVEVANYAPGFQKLELTADRKEIVIPVTPGGRLQLLLPAGMKNDESAIWNSKLRIEDATGAELTALFTSLRPWLGAGGGSSDAEGTVLIPHAPPGRLKISLGGEGTGIEPKQAEVSVEEGGEAVASTLNGVAGFSNILLSFRRRGWARLRISRVDRSSKEGSWICRWSGCACPTGMCASWR